MHSHVMHKRQVVENKKRPKKHCTCVYIREFIIAGGTVIRVFTLKRDISAKNTPSDLRVCLIRRCSLVEILL